MHRRHVLRTSGAALAAGLAGCTALRGSSDDEGSPCPTEIPRLEQADYRGEYDVVCNDGSDDGDDETRLVPDPRSASLPDASLEFTLTNGREDHFNADFYRWSLQKRVDGEWYATTDGASPEPDGSSLGPDESHSWRLTVDNGNLERVVDPVEIRAEGTVRALGSGTYAFLVAGSYGAEGEPPQANSPQVGYAAQFTLEGDPLSLEPTENVVDVSRDGDAVVVRAAAEPSRTVTLERTDEAASERHRDLITEQLYGEPVLRDALAHIESDDDRVRVESTVTGVSDVEQWNSIAYDGDTYTVTVGSQ